MVKRMSVYLYGTSLSFDLTGTLAWNLHIWSRAAAEIKIRRDCTGVLCVMSS